MATKIRVEERCWCKGKFDDCRSCKGTGKTTRYETAFRCIGGPFDGQRKNRSALDPDEYHIYNRGYRLSRQRKFTAVFIHVSNLEPEDE